MWQVFWRKFAALAGAACVIAAWLAAAPAYAACGNPPDPRSNSAGYASWCSCMGGSYNYQTTACTGAHGPAQRGGGGNASGGNSWPAQHWYCRARASNGAYGWGRYGDRGAAERNALARCDSYARGRACRIVGCSYVGGTPPPGSSPTASATSPQPGAASPSAAPPFGALRKPTAVCGGRICLAGQVCGPTHKCYDPTRHYYCGTRLCVTGRHYLADSACGACAAEHSSPGRAVPGASFVGTQTCEQCYRKLKADIRFGWITHRPRSYIAGAISGYLGCKQKIGGACTAGDGFRTAVNGCASPSFNDAGVRACVSNVLTHDPSTN